MDKTTDAVYKYAKFKEGVTFIHRAEDFLFSRTLKPGLIVLDLGCGTGRVTRELEKRQLIVHACDLEPEAIKNIKCGDNAILQIADARSLPYANNMFDVVIFAYNGIDYMNPESDRILALKEVDRILKPNGFFIFSSHNPIGGILSPRGLRSLQGITWRIRSLLRGDFLKKYAKDRNEMTLWNGTPNRVISQIEGATTLRFQMCLDKTARSTSKALLTLFCPWPHYLFRKV